MNKFAKCIVMPLCMLGAGTFLAACSDEEEVTTIQTQPATGSKSRAHSLNYTEQELIYLSGVAEDLCRQCVRLEAAWAGMDKISQTKQTILETAELEPTRNYGEEMKNAGSSNPLYKTYTEAAEQLIQGCIDIADEVGVTKMGRPHLGSTEEDRNYIESPYSLNSIMDFQENIRSIQNAYCGSNAADASVSDYIRSVNPSLDTRVCNAINRAISCISVIPEPFAATATGTQTAVAIAACDDLVSALEAVMATLNQGNADVAVRERMLKDAITAYVEQTIVPTYSRMADAAIEMSGLCTAMLEKFRSGTLATEDVEAAGRAWNNARKYWELSEAFLFGAAADYNIDPHIDSWPLDKNSMDAYLHNPSIMSLFNADVASKLGYGLLGFHAVEYLLFELYDED